MSVLNKCILGLFAVLCLMQCVAMARVRRDVGESNAGSADSVGALPGLSGAQIGNAIDSLIAKLKATLDDNTLRDFVASTTKVLSEGTKKIQEQLGSINTE